MIFKQLFDTKSSTYTYLISSGNGREALIIDPVLENVNEYINILKQLDLKLVKVIDTHIHADHVTGASKLKDITKCSTIMGDHTPAESVEIKVKDEEYINLDNIKKYIDMVGEAHKMGGEPVLAAMWRNVVQGKPLNFDRATKFTLEAVKAENTPYYVDLTTKYGMSPEEASAFIYKNIGEPIKEFDENGEIHYTSKQNPNKINFYAGRARQRYFWAGQTKQDYYRPEWANKNILMEYSPGKITAAEVYEPGTKAFNIMSGLVDASYQLVPELFAAKGVKGFKNLGRGLRGINPALESVELGRIKQTGKSIKISPRAQADEILKSVGDEIDGVTGTGNMSKYVDEDGRFIKGKEYKKDYRQTKKFLKKQITANIARNIWGNKEYYKIILDRDEYIIEALSHN